MVPTFAFFRLQSILYAFLLQQLDRTLVGMLTYFFNWAIAKKEKTLLSQRLTKVIRTSLQVMSQTAFRNFLSGLTLTKKLFQFHGFFFMRNIFQNYVKFKHRKNKKVFRETKKRKNRHCLANLWRLEFFAPNNNIIQRNVFC